MKKIDIDFQVIDTYDTRYLSVADYSEWGGIENKPAIIEITTPGEVEPVVHFFEKKSINRYNSTYLGLNCPECSQEAQDYDIPDGIYEIVIKGSPSKYSKRRVFLKTTQTKLKLDLLIMNNISSCGQVDKLFVEKLMEIEHLIGAAEANTRYGNEAEANELFERAQKLIDKNLNC